MFRRMAAVVLCLCVVLMGTALSVSAAPIEKSLLIPDKTASPSADAAFSYAESGTLTVTASAQTGGSVAVTMDQLLNVKNVRYLQVAVRATAPFNIALKVGGTEKDIYPQLAGPSWYEAFVGTRDGNEAYIPSGEYVVSLDLIQYVEYNGLSIDTNGYVQLKTVFLMLGGAGTLTVERLMMSNTADFSLTNGQTGAAAPTLPMLEEIHDTEVTQAGERFEQPAFILEPENQALVIVLVLVGAAVLIVALAVAAVVKMKADAAAKKDDERYFRIADEVAREMAKKAKKKRMMYSPDRPRPVKSKAEYLREFKILGAANIDVTEETENPKEPEAAQPVSEEPAAQPTPSPVADKPTPPNKKKNKKKRKR